MTHSPPTRSEAEPETETCERCQGNGEIVTDWDRYMHGPLDENGEDAVEPCPDCDGEGTLAVRQPNPRVSAMMVDDPNWIAAGIPDEVIEAGISVWYLAETEMTQRVEAEHPEDMRDWDEGMIVAAIFKAMLREAFKGVPTHD